MKKSSYISLFPVYKVGISGVYSLHSVIALVYLHVMLIKSEEKGINRTYIVCLYFINWTNLLLENYIAFSFLPSAEHCVHISFVCCALCDQFCMGYLLFHQMFYWFRYFSFRSPSPWLHFLLNMWCTFLLRVYTFVLCNLRGECKRVLFAAFFNST